MLRVLPFFSLLLIPLLTIFGIVAGGMWLWATPVFAFGLLPFLDHFAGEARERIEVSAAGLRLADWLLWLYVPIQIGIMFYAGYIAPEFVATSGWGIDMLAMCLATGALSGGIGITLAHELVHRREMHSYWAGCLLLSSVCYGHFAVEHVLGHHTHVGTLGDPATARRGESSWAFVLRSMVTSFPSAWRIEKLRLSRLKKSAWSFSNRLFQVWTLSGFFSLGFFLIGGLPALQFFFAQAFVAVLLLELINYVEHYGLSREILANGKPEPIQMWHSWDSHSRLSGYFLINLSRHADHHKYPARPFTKLEGSQLSPLLPLGYPASVLLATLPPLWYLVMHARLDAFERSRKAQ